MKRILSIVLFFMVIASCPAFATIIDLPNGEFYDQASNLTWKDPHNYTGLSYNAVLASLAPGWHIATEAEVISMLASAGTNYNFLQGVMGHSVNPNSGGGFIAGFYNNIGSQWYDPNSIWVGGAYLNEGFINEDTGMNQWNVLSQWWYKDPGLGYSGTWVNNAPVPIPGAILLFAPGLAGIAVLRRRFKK